MKYIAPQGDCYAGIFEYISEDKKDSRIMALYYEPLHWYDFKEQRFVYEREFYERFRYYKEKPYVTTQERIMQFLKKWSIRLAKCPLRVLWVMLYVLMTIFCLIMFLLYPLEWLAVGRVFNPVRVVYYIDNLRRKL